MPVVRLVPFGRDRRAGPAAGLVSDDAGRAGPGEGVENDITGHATVRDHPLA